MWLLFYSNPNRLKLANIEKLIKNFATFLHDNSGRGSTTLGSNRLNLIDNIHTICFGVDCGDWSRHLFSKYDKVSTAEICARQLVRYCFVSRSKKSSITAGPTGLTNNRSEDNVLSIQPRSVSSTDEELRTVSSWSSIGHGQDSPSLMLQLKVFIVELVPVDGFSTCV